MFFLFITIEFLFFFSILTRTTYAPLHFRASNCYKFETKEYVYECCVSSLLSVGLLLFVLFSVFGGICIYSIYTNFVRIFHALPCCYSFLFALLLLFSFFSR
eukprot:Rmarinus@m.4541